MTLSPELTNALVALPETDRIELARALVESIGSEEPQHPTMDEAIRRLEELISGKAKALSEEDFRRQLSQ
jgi:putative addiction module component (TIGR02574 family)